MRRCITHGSRARLNPGCAQPLQYINLLKQLDPKSFQNPWGPLYSIPRQCRVLPSFEPAFAGGSLPRNAALAQAYRVISLGVRDPKIKCWLKTGSATSRTQQGRDSYTIKVGARVGIN